jgi:methyl-accepting chemotaxis protein
VLELRYEPYEGAAIASLGRLFDVRRVPASGFDPPKYRTAYDALVDEEIVDVMDATLARHPWLGFALPIDLNAYGPMHNSNFCHDWTGEHDRDLVGNRIKRFFWDGDLLVRGARVGIERCPASQMATRAEFVAARAELHEPAGGDPRYLVQTYARDTGAVMSVLTAPIYVHGERWGAVLLGWAAAALQALA